MFKHYNRINSNVRKYFRLVIITAKHNLCHFVCCPIKLFHSPFLSLLLFRILSLSAIFFFFPTLSLSFSLSHITQFITLSKVIVIYIYLITFGNKNNDNCYGKNSIGFVIKCIKFQINRSYVCVIQLSTCCKLFENT